MEYTTLKSTGLTVSRLCLGTMTFGDQADQEESGRILDCCLDNGVNFIDTADIYCRGESERILGRLLKGRRDTVVLASKVGGPSCEGKNGSGLSRKHIVESVEKSLERLQTDYLDILYLHFPDRRTPFFEIISTMDQLIRSGKIRYYGVSNFAAWQCCDMIHTAREMNAAPPVVSESVYNLLTRGIEDEMVPFADRYQFGLTVFNPLAGGLLTGKHTREKPAENSRFSREKGYAARYWNDRNFDAIELLTQAAQQSGLSLLALSLRWLRSRSAVDSVICGASNAAQIEENISFFDGAALDEAALAQCDQAWDLLRGRYFNYHR